VIDQENPSFYENLSGEQNIGEVDPGSEADMSSSVTFNRFVV